MGEKLIIYNRDGSKTEVEPLKAWQPDVRPREMDGRKMDEWLSNALGFEINRSLDNPWAGPKPFSSDIACAWELMIVMTNRGKRPRITRVAENEWACSMNLDEPTAYSSSAPRAISEAVILSLMS
jgi:hypothetical protein